MGELLTATRIHIAARSRKAAFDGYKGMPPLISDEPSFMGVRPQCPRCSARIDQLECQFCGFKMRADHGIVYALLPDRSAYYARFIADCERITAAEGRGSEEHEFYLELPHRDLSGRNSKQWKIRARSYDYLLKHVLNRNLKGDVDELWISAQEIAG